MPGSAGAARLGSWLQQHEWIYIYTSGGMTVLPFGLPSVVSLAGTSASLSISPFHSTSGIRLNGAPCLSVKAQVVGSLQKYMYDCF